MNLFEKIISKDEKSRDDLLEISSIIGIFINIFLSLFKITIGLLFKSIALFGDGLNNLSDALSSVISLVGFKMARKPADKEHPFGHARYEYVTGLVVSFIIIIIGFELFMSSFERLFSDIQPVFDIFIVISLVTSIVLKLFLYAFNMQIFKKTNSTTVKATAKDSLNDVYVSSGVLISALIFYFSGYNIDAFVGILLSFVIMLAGFNLTKETLSPLIGEAPPKDMISSIYQRLRKYENVLDIHDLIVHSYGYEKYFVSVHIEVDASIDILVLHETADTIERDFKGDGMHLIVHLDPVLIDCEESSIYKNCVVNAIKEIDKRLTIHDFRMVKGIKNHNLIFDVVKPCEIDLTDDELILKISDKVCKEHQNVTLVIEIDKHYNGL